MDRRTVHKTGRQLFYTADAHSGDRATRVLLVVWAGLAARLRCRHGRGAYSRRPMASSTQSATSMKSPSPLGGYGIHTSRASASVGTPPATLPPTCPPPCGE